MLQNLPSIVTAQVMNPQSGWKVLDMCAAPGGKTTAMAEWMGDQGEVIALDRTHKKVWGNDPEVTDLHLLLHLGDICARVGNRTRSFLHYCLQNGCHEGGCSGDKIENVIIPEVVQQNYQGTSTRSTQRSNTSSMSSANATRDSTDADM